MVKVINKNTKVIKELSSEELVSMYLATGEWELYKEKIIEKKVVKPIEKKNEKINFFITKEKEVKGK